MRINNSTEVFQLLSGKHCRPVDWEYNEINEKRSKKLIEWNRRMLSVCLAVMLQLNWAKKD